MLESRILPYFGHYKLNKITSIDIMKLYDLLEKDTQIIIQKSNNGKPIHPSTISK